VTGSRNLKILKVGTACVVFTEIYTSSKHHIRVNKAGAVAFRKQVHVYILVYTADYVL
jgi:hypothetical protein